MLFRENLIPLIRLPDEDSTKPRPSSGPNKVTHKHSNGTSQSGTDINIGDEREENGDAMPDKVSPRR